MSYFLETTVESFPNGAVLLFADVAIKATALLLFAIFTNVLLSRRAAAIRHRVWSLAFGGLLFLPLLAAMLPGLQLPILPPAADVIGSLTAPPSAVEVGPAELKDDRLTEELVLNSVMIEESSAVIDDDVFAQSPLPQMDANNDLSPLADSANADDSDTKVSEAAGGEAVIFALGPRVLRCVAYSLWSIGFLFTVWPLVMGFIRIAALQKGAKAIDDASQLTRLQKLSGSLGLRRQVNLLETPRAIVPITWGIRRPIVLFPIAWREWTIERGELILLHELAHVKRLDVAWQLVARLVCAFYWFHPLSWYALRRLRIERELACDDCVLMTGARPSEYARELVEMARSYQVLTLSTTVAMAHTTNLEQRVKSLLDRARSHVPVGRMTGRLLLVLSVLVVTGIAIVRPSAKASETVVRTFVAEQKANDDTTSRVIGASGESEKPVSRASVIVRGIVLLPDGSPAVDATVQASARVWDIPMSILQPDYRPSVVSAKTDKKGRFEIEIAKQPYGDLSRHSERWQNIWQETVIAASLPGYGGQWVKYKNIPDTSKASLKLVEDRPINGRVIDVEGHPIVGLKIQIGGPRKNDDEDLSEWIEAAKAGEVPWTLVKHAPSQVDARLINVATSVTTDASGRFELRGRGRERQFDVFVASESVAHATFGIAARKMPAFERRIIQTGQFGNPTQDVFGSEFTYTATPSRRGVGSDEIKGPKDKKSSNFDTYRNPVHPGLKWPNALKEIDVAEETGSVVVNFALDSGPTVNITTKENRSPACE